MMVTVSTVVEAETSNLFLKHMNMTEKFLKGSGQLGQDGDLLFRKRPYLKTIQVLYININKISINIITNYVHIDNTNHFIENRFLYNIFLV